MIDASIIRMKTELPTFPMESEYTGYVKGPTGKSERYVRVYKVEKLQEKLALMFDDDVETTDDGIYNYISYTAEDKAAYWFRTMFQGKDLYNINSEFLVVTRDNPDAIKEDALYKGFFNIGAVFAGFKPALLEVIDNRLHVMKHQLEAAKTLEEYVAIQYHMDLITEARTRASHLNDYWDVNFYK